ncbi:MAG: hypothetical protein V1827_01675 [Candidatus Micrarchaeota archaeon]
MKAKHAKHPVPPYALLLAFLIIISASAPLAFAEDTALEEGTESSSLEIVRDWRLISALALMFSIFLVALAYMVGHAFDMPEIKAWAQNEMIQVFVTCIIIISFTAVALLLDVYMEAIVNGSNLGFDCEGSNNCAVTVAHEYLSGNMETALNSARENVVEAGKASQAANYRFGLSTPVLIPMLQLSTSFTASADRIMEVERRNVVIEYLGNILSSLYSQEFFVSEISYKLAPMVLAIGIVARSFFVTRRVGGLLIAVGIGVMYVFPLMYVFDWMTLSITMFGGASVEPPASACPAACLIAPPRFYSVTEGVRYFNAQNLSAHLVESGMDEDVIKIPIAFLDEGLAPDYNFGGEEVVSCQATECPSSCRDLPYSTASECQADGIPQACASLNPGCRFIRYVNPDHSSDDIYSDGLIENGECPIRCRSVPPLKANCTMGGCLDGSDLCRYARRLNADETGPMTRPTNCMGEGDLDPDPSLDCDENLTATESCVWVLPSEEDIESHDCDSCNFVPQSYTYDPPIYLACTDLCNPSPSGPPKISPSEFTRRSAEGMVGKEEIKGVAALMLPAYVLPILNILVTLIFIRSFSQLIGGDVDIPGLSKIL